MGLLTDILKEIPQAAVLKEKIADIEAKYAAADTENAILKDDLRQAKAKTEELKKQIGELTRSDDDLDEVEQRILIDLAVVGYRAQATFIEDLTEQMKVHVERVRFHLRRLVDTEYVHYIPGSPSIVDQYRLRQKGREWLIRRGLIR